MAALLVRNLVRTLADRERRFELAIAGFSLEPGDRKAIVGTTGSGKTTAMDVLALASPPDSFERFAITEDDGRTAELPAPGGRGAERRLAALRARHFGYVVQTSPLFPFLTLRDNVRLQQRLAGRPDEALVDRLIGALDLEGEADARPEGLSVGQRQRTAVARALAHRPSFLLCDEPTGALDEETAALCLLAMETAARESGAAILMITHEPELASACGYTLLPIERRPAGAGRFRAVLDDRAPRDLAQGRAA